MPRTMAAVTARPLLAALALLSLVTPAASVEVCKVVDLQLVTQTGEFFLAGKPSLLMVGLLRAAAFAKSCRPAVVQ